MQETEASIANKLSRGTFSATFMFAALIAIGCEVVKLEDISFGNGCDPYDTAAQPKATR